jgi:hypothetical protein
MLLKHSTLFKNAAHAAWYLQTIEIARCFCRLQATTAGVASEARMRAMAALWWLSATAKAERSAAGM